MNTARSSLPLFVSIKERFCLNREGSDKETYHLVLDLTSTPLEYEVGDCIGIYPSNDPLLVQTILSCFPSFETIEVHDREGKLFPFHAFLTHKANVTRVNRSLLELLLQKSLPSSLYSQLHFLLSSEGKESLRAFLSEVEIPYFIKTIPPGTLTAQELCSHLAPLMPRYYSIASSRHLVGNEVHLTVGVPRYQLQGNDRVGVCSHFLCHLAPLNEPIVPIFLHKARDFLLAQEALTAPLIMIGPGTGIAPFRAFLQERMVKNPLAKNWLFFGERRRNFDFYYEDYLTSLSSKNLLRLDLAFSRDQVEKVYVQHKMQQSAQDLWQWIQEGAYIYVCGDASRMAKDVDATLHSIACQEGSFSEKESKEFFKSLRQNKRYLRDVY